MKIHAPCMKFHSIEGEDLDWKRKNTQVDFEEILRQRKLSL